jgi:hypothetical protein
LETLTLTKNLLTKKLTTLAIHYFGQGDCTSKGNIAGNIAEVPIPAQSGTIMTGTIESALARRSKIFIFLGDSSDGFSVVGLCSSGSPLCRLRSLSKSEVNALSLS